MKKYLGLLAVLLALAAGLYFTLRNQHKDDFAASEHTQFAYEHSDQIGKIFIANRQQKSVLLERNGDGWTYTDPISKKSYPANPATLDIMLQTLRDIRVRNPVVKGKVDFVVKELATRGRKVEIYDLSGKLVRTFYVGGSTDGGAGTYMQIEGGNRPYIVYIPNWVGTVDSRFSVDEKTWRDPALFRIKPQDLEWVEVRYADPNQKNMSFRLEPNAQPAVRPLDGSKTPIDAKLLNPDNVSTYVEDFDVLGAEVILKDENHLYDSLQRLPLFAEVSYKTTKMQEATRFKLYPVINPSADRGDGEVGTRQKIQRYFADVDRDHFYLMQHLVVRKILWGYDYFFKEGKVVLEDDNTVFSNPETGKK